ncbi:TPA: hypothetical protein N2826_005047 [Vibrio parahaemolyticus]|uniref:hypothetical protein n=1 Tax=Vibrio parahaemolyticus TaxID=670 RepID=UPI00215C5488|nr:hypothetical protein [Vibrio parahaemolyticus]EGR0933194.1 hypothetical protein [Vibrio parahaemolyticus]MCS0013918.1 hypothetical protein [Vibrio parahaemolyticus]HCM0880711.1 hypothetical protein [Vibrio parahaemolyticus]HCM0884500.1 hypothetical protein [Vibrio parahaemolyticus]
MLKPIKKVQQDSESSYCELTHIQLLREVGSLDEHRREQLKNQEYQEEAEKRINSIREKMKQHEQSRLVSQEEALLEQSERERKRRELLEQLGGIDE